ncbi:hypothetical protein L861_06950 [Litchfieldella anticariensis FP35 = DSM 16096]|uniref:Uncharacterized protein n=1 Tax=Litchfieldella anticariensis (strain DSM 16096 / CECT 5854 / CIP 108499 / LMG 22089 / FP35) TaxID=1121939 RepID=S2KEE2_LITA3|nr:hypothetical protein [Halomonas anticariensis]EPC00225.1 hypothetical protein L861_06950 [Halomonas anticariensis FP35 = DSM 16096]
MSANETFDGYYAATAYTPEQRRQWEEAHPKRDKIFGTRLSWDRKTRDTGTEDEYGFNNIAISQNWEAQRAEKNLEGDEVFCSLKVRYDHQAIMPPNYKLSAYLIYMSTAIGKGFFFLSLLVMCVAILGMLGMAFFDGEYEKSFLAILMMAKLVFPVALVTFVLWKGGGVLNQKRPDIFLGMRKGPLWEANRQTGLFTIYHPKKPWKRLLQAPFHEFDAFLQSSPDTQGSSTYSLILYHPMERLKQTLDAQFPSTNMQGELIAAWQFLQRYMDVSQPLPDVPALEIHRHKDPTTAGADKRKKRNPRYWRDMDEESVKKIQKEKYRKNIRIR